MHPLKAKIRVSWICPGWKTFSKVVHRQFLYFETSHLLNLQKTISKLFRVNWNFRFFWGWASNFNSEFSLG